MKAKKDINIDKLLEKLSSYIKDESDIESIKRAFLFSSLKHGAQFRKSGEPYIIHPIEVADILTTVYADSETIQAALLHDILEDCDCTEEEMIELFGREVTTLVKGVTKLSKIHFSTENDYLIDYYKKIIVGISEDVRVIIIKLADRLHNMRTLWAVPVEKQKQKSKESLDIFAPIAHHLGIFKIKSELEDISLRYLKPDVFYDIAEKLNKTKLERDKTVFDMQKDVTNLLQEHSINHEIKGRSKSIYSIYNKLDKGKKFSDIYDLQALRILVNTEQECYLALGLIHSKFRPLPKRFKDYVAMPKPNRYQSLHTTVFGVDGYLFEIQIRTYEMDEIAENGIAAHWSYKEKGSAVDAMKNTTEQKLQFFKTIMELSNDKMSSEEFVNSVKNDVLNNNIYVFTPKGDIFELPVGSTPIDFAYKVHTRIGETMVGAIVNNSIVPLNYELQNNDIVKINTNKNSTPSKEWIKIAKATQTKNKIKSYFTKSDRELHIESGKDLLEKELRRRKLSISEFLVDDNLSVIYDNLKIDNIEELYLVIGNGKTPVNGVINLIDKKDEEVTPKVIKVLPKQVDTDIIVSGIEKVKVNLAHCCNPVYGDDIIGYITMGNGISIHRSHCHNLASAHERCVEVSWGSNINKRYLANLMIFSNTNKDHMVDLIQICSKFDVSLDGIKIINRAVDYTYEASLYVKSLEQLEKLILNINKNSYIIKVERVMR